MDEARWIDPTTWPRASIYAHYRNMGHPWLSLTAEVEVGGLLQRCDQTDRSFFAAMLYRLAWAANRVPAFRQRIRSTPDGERVIEHPRVDPAFTVAVEDGCFAFAAVALEQDEERFHRAVAAESRSKRTDGTLQPHESHRDDVIFMSCLPWVRFSSLTHPVHTDRIDCIPRIAWGRYHRDGERARLPVNIQVHHALIDGVHVGAFFDELERRLRADEDALG